MRTTVFLIALCLLGISRNKQERLPSGIYANCDKTLVVHDKTLYCILDQGTDGIYATDTIATCTLERKDNNWYEINSVDDFRRKTFSTARIILNEDSGNLKDSVCFKVHTSSKTTILLADLTYIKPSNKGYYGGASFPIVGGEGCITIAREEIKSLQYLSISPKWPMYELESLLYNGLASEAFSIEGYDINKTNYVEILISGIDDAYFQRYNVYHEYVKITNDYLLWRGIKYLRQYCAGNPVNPE